MKRLRWTEATPSAFSRCGASGRPLRARYREDDYREKAAEALRLAQHKRFSSDKTRLVKLAEGWVELAGKAHEDTQRPRRPTILHPLVQKKLGDLPD
jgi:hypothetical protein